MDRVVPAVNHEEEKEKEKKPATDVVSPERVSYPRIDPEDLVPPPPLMTTTADVHTASAQKSVSWSEVLIQEPPPRSTSETITTTSPTESNPYVAVATPAPTGSSKVTMDKLKSMLGRWGKKVGEAAKKTEDLAGNTWQHLRTGPSFADAAMGRITQTTKVIAEGGYDKIFRSTFDVLPEEQLKKTFACYLSTSAGPVMGMLYLSSAKLAFCSDAPLSYSVVDKTEWSYYKVIIPLHQLRTASPSSSKLKPAEKYIQVVSIDNHEFWFLGFVNYDSAVKSLQEACLVQNLQT